jgi:hypothetical protein
MGANNLPVTKQATLLLCCRAAVIPSESVPEKNMLAFGKAGDDLKMNSATARGLMVSVAPEQRLHRFKGLDSKAEIVRWKDWRESDLGVTSHN